MRRRHPAVALPPPVTPPDAAPADMPDGYRVIRTLGVGSRSRVYLAHVDPRGGSMALKVFSPDRAENDIDNEVSALESVRSLHVVRLLDISASPGAVRCLILERLEGGTLAALLRGRSRIRTGEAVTILVSVFRGIRDLHAVGFAHNALSLSTVLFDRAGRPVIIGLGHAIDMNTAEDGANAGRSDWERYRTIAQAVLDHVEAEGRAHELEAIAGALDRLVDARNAATESFEDTLFALNQAAPVVLRPTVPDSASTRARSAGGDVEDGTRPGTPQLQSPAEGRPAHRGVHGRRQTASAQRPSMSIAGRVEAVLDAGPLRVLGARLLPVVRRKRKPLLLAAIVAGVVGVAGLAALPPSSSEAHTSRAHTAQAGSGAARAPRPEPGSAVVRTPKPSHPASTPSAGGSAQEGDDPVTAAMELLTLRTHCLAAASRACLGGVDQLDSAQFAADLGLLPQGGTGVAAKSFTDYSGFEVSLIQRTGNSALVELAPGIAESSPGAQPKPASAIVIKGEAGWRIREIFQN